MSPIPFKILADAFSDPVEPAAFPSASARFKNHRWAESVGLDHLSNQHWKDHFWAFEPLPRNLPQPLAMRYHGHQFGVYNPQLGDGRGFLFAQLKDKHGRLLDLGTKGSGQTPWSRQGDGRLTLKGGVREILAASYLEALGVNTSKAFSLFETGEDLTRNDEPSPTRSSVLVRLSHSHIRFGTFQRAAYLELKDDMAALVQYCVDHFYPDCANTDTPAQTLDLFEHITIATAKMIGQWMAAGFVHGVMNTDNFNVTGETFDFGPWRFLPHSDPNFVAAYFDQNGLYRFGRQPTQGMWALQQLASALLLIADNAVALSNRLTAYSPAYQRSMADHSFRLLGLGRGDSLEDDLSFLQAFYGWMSESAANWPQTFFDWYSGTLSKSRAKTSPQANKYSVPAFHDIEARMGDYAPSNGDALQHPYFQQAAPVTLLYDDVEALWAPIVEKDDWSEFESKLAHIEMARQAYGN